MHETRKIAYTVNVLNGHSHSTSIQISIYQNEPFGSERYQDFAAADVQVIPRCIAPLAIPPRSGFLVFRYKKHFLHRDCVF